MSETLASHYDSGWAFVIAFSYFFTKVILVGISYPSSIFYSAFLEEFDQLPSTTAWATSLNTCTFFFFGELVNIVVSMVGCRATVAIGCAMSSLGLLFTSFATNLPTVIFTHGLLTGLGFSFAWFPGFPMVVVYFKKFRAFVFVAGSMGMSVAVFVFPLLANFLIERYHWRGAFMILSAINLNMLVIAASYFLPPAPSRATLLPQDDQEKADSGLTRAVNYLKNSVSLLKYKTYCLFLFGYVLYGMGMNAFLTHVSNVAIVRGFSNAQAALLPSGFGIAGMFGRLLMLFFTHTLRLSVINIFIIYYSLMGLAIAVFGFATNYIFMFVCCITAGFLFSVEGAEPMMVMEIVGVKNLSSGISCNSLLYAAGAMFGGPLSGWAFEMDSSYRSSFFLAGACLIVHGTINIPFWVKSRKRQPEVLE